MTAFVICCWAHSQTRSSAKPSIEYSCCGFACVTKVDEYFGLWSHECSRAEERQSRAIDWAGRKCLRRPLPLLSS
jgi:hypothetical protein